MPLDPATEAAIALEVARYAAATEEVKAAAESAIRGLWVAFQGWYDRRAVERVAAQAARISRNGQQTIVGATQRYAANTYSLTAGTRQRALPRVAAPAIRNGQPLPLVHSRPAERFKKAVATGKSVEEAVNLALGRAATITYTDMTLVQRVYWRELMEDLGVQRYRRVLRPELSESGSCGLCIAAADRVYKIFDLMPIHPPSCKCITLPVVGDNDPGLNLNSEDLERLYADAGSTNRRDLSRTRYKVNLHGEFGPVLTRADDEFRGPDKVALEDDPERAARMLAQVEPVLARMEAAGGPAGALEYQRDLAARLRRITAA